MVENSSCSLTFSSKWYTILLEKQQLQSPKTTDKKFKKIEGEGSTQDKTFQNVGKLNFFIVALLIKIKFVFCIEKYL